MMQNSNASLYALSDHGQTVDGSANDVRGRQVKDQKGDGIGKIADLLVDDQEHEVRFLLVKHGGFLGFGETESLVPVQAITKITAEDVFIDKSREHVASAPGYSPDLVNDPPHHSSIYNHYGYSPYWETNYSFLAGLPVQHPPTRN